MAKDWEVENTRGNIYLFDPAVIKFKPELNGRVELPDITELKESIREVGRLQPVGVRDEAGEPVLIMGFSRWRAIAELNDDLKPEGKDRIKVMAIYMRCNEQEGYMRNWDENRKRNHTTPLDDAHHFGQLERWGWDEKKIADRYKVSVKFVKDRLTLLQVEPEVQEALKSKRIKTGAAVKLAKISSDQQRKLVKGSGKVDTKQVEALTQTKSKKPNLVEVKEFLEIRMAQAGQTDSVRKFCTELMEYINGTATKAAAK